MTVYVSASVKAHTFTARSAEKVGSWRIEIVRQKKGGVRTCGARMLPCRARPWPFCGKGLRPPPRTSPRPFVLCVPWRRVRCALSRASAGAGRLTVGLQPAVRVFSAVHTTGARGHSTRHLRLLSSVGAGRDARLLPFGQLPAHHALQDVPPHGDVEHVAGQRHRAQRGALPVPERHRHPGRPCQVAGPGSTSLSLTRPRSTPGLPRSAATRRGRCPCYGCERRELTFVRRLLDGQSGEAAPAGAGRACARSGWQRAARRRRRLLRSHNSVSVGKHTARFGTALT